MITNWSRISLKLSRRQSLKARVPVKFPASVVGINGIHVEKANGVYTIEPRWADLALATAIESPETRQVWAYDPATQSYFRVALQAIVDAVISINGQLPTIVTGSSYNVQDETTIVVARTSPVGDFTLNLPTVAYRNARPLRVIDLSTGIGVDGHNVVLTPNGNSSLDPDPEAPAADAFFSGSEHIMRRPTWTLFSQSGFLASGTFWPSSLLNGWYTAP